MDGKVLILLIELSNNIIKHNLLKTYEFQIFIATICIISLHDKFSRVGLHSSYHSLSLPLF